MPTTTRPKVMSLFLPGQLIAFPARIQPPPPNVNSRMASVQPNLSPGVATAPGMSIMATKLNIATPHSKPDQGTRIFVAMLKAAASSAKPKKYAQNNGHGMYVGTMVARLSAAARWRAPKTAKGAAKHKLFKATILSRPWARAISDFAAQSAMSETRMPAASIEVTVRENMRNVARIIVGIFIASFGPRALPGARFPGQYGFRLYNEE